MLPSQGSAVSYSLYSSFNTTVRAAHFAFLPFFPPSAQEIAENNITLSDVQKVTEQRTIEWNATGHAYFLEQATKVRNIPLHIDVLSIFKSCSPMTSGWPCTTALSGS